MQNTVKLDSLDAAKVAALAFIPVPAGLIVDGKEIVVIFRATSDASILLAIDTLPGALVVAVPEGATSDDIARLLTLATTTPGIKTVNYSNLTPEPSAKSWGWGD